MSRKQEGLTHSDEYLRKWEVYVRKWRARTFFLGIALVLSVAACIPFLAGHALHRYFDRGRYLIYVSCGLLTLLGGSSAMTWNFWWYLRKLRANRIIDSNLD